MALNIVGNLIHYYSIAVSFIFGAFLEEWISGRVLIKEPKGTKLIGTTEYLKKPIAITVRITEVIAIPLFSIPTSLLLLFLLEKSKYYVFIISIVIFNTIYLGTLLELPYKIKPKELWFIIPIYVICVGLIILIYYLTRS